MCARLAEIPRISQFFARLLRKICVLSTAALSRFLHLNALPTRQTAATKFRGLRNAHWPIARRFCARGTPKGRCQQLTPPENVGLGDHFHTSEQHVIFAFLLAYIQARSLKKTLRKLDSIRSLLYEQLRRRPKHRFSQNHTLHTMHTQKHARTAQKTIFSPARKSRPRA